MIIFKLGFGRHLLQWEHTFLWDNNYPWTGTLIPWQPYQWLLTYATPPIYRFLWLPMGKKYPWETDYPCTILPMDHLPLHFYIHKGWAVWNSLRIRSNWSKSRSRQTWHLDSNFNITVPLPLILLRKPFLSYGKLRKVAITFSHRVCFSYRMGLS